MTARIIEEEFSHPANATAGWYVKVRGTREEVLGEAGRALAEASALAHGWTADDQATAGWPTSHNLREEDRVFTFYAEGTWAYHQDCWCRHSFCPHSNRQGEGCTAPAPYTKGQVTFA